MEVESYRGCDLEFVEIRVNYFYLLFKFVFWIMNLLDIDVVVDGSFWIWSCNGENC